MTTGSDYPGAFGNGPGDAIRDWLITQIADPTGAQVSSFFQARAAVLASAAAPVLAWLRDNIVLRLDHETVRHTLSLSCLCMLDRSRIFIGVPTPGRESTRQDVSAMPDAPTLLPGRTARLPLGCGLARATRRTGRFDALLCAHVFHSWPTRDRRMRCRAFSSDRLEATCQ